MTQPKRIPNVRMAETPMERALRLAAEKETGTLADMCATRVKNTQRNRENVQAQRNKEKTSGNLTA